jgi:UPF0716 protein FxsA
MGVLLFVAFIVVPLIELWVIIQIGDAIGLVQTIVALITVSLLGAALVKREGLRAWRNFQEALRAGRAPAKEVVNGALILFAGALMLTPGFVTDAVGLACLLPPSRALIARVVRRRGRVAFGMGGSQGLGWPQAGGPQDSRRGGAGAATGPSEAFGGSSRGGSAGGDGSAWRSGRSSQSSGAGPGRAGARRDADVVDVEVVSVERNDDGNEES